jgi:hypothetical protein
MCLYSITQRYDPPLEGEAQGWKIVEIDEDGYLPFFMANQVDRRSFNQWYEATGNEYIYCDDGAHQYQPYFHVFKEKAIAERYRDAYQSNFNELRIAVVRVNYREVTCEGLQRVGTGHYTCVVAKRMCVYPPSEA